MNTKPPKMEYFNYLFLYEIIARQYGDIMQRYENLLNGNTDVNQIAETQEKIAEAEANYEKYWNRAELFVSTETKGRIEADGTDDCPPPKRPPCKWPDEHCDQDELVCIEAQYIENIDLVVPTTDSDTYTVVIKNSTTKNIVVNYEEDVNDHRFFKYNASAGLLKGEKYEFEITISDDIGDVKTIIYPFKIKP